MNQTAGGYDGSRGPLFSDMLRLAIRAKKVPVPRCLKNLDGELFQRCTVCDVALQEPANDHLIVRNFLGPEPIYEMALCLDCAENLGESYSDESRQYIDGLFQASGWVKQAFARLDDLPDDWDRHLGACSVTGQPRHEFREYQIIGQCEGGIMEVGFFPYIIGTRGIDVMQAGLSQETLDTWDRFVGEHLGLPPELRSLPI